MDSNHRSVAGMGRRCSTGKRRQCEVAHTSPRLERLRMALPGVSSGVFEWWSDHAERRLMQKEHAAARTRPACTRHPPRARADRTTDCAHTGSMLPGSGKTFINSALAYTAKDRRIACYAGPVARIGSGRSSPATGRKTALRVSPPSRRRSRGLNCRRSWRSRRGVYGTT
jgi:hypothetical protein